MMKSEFEDLIGDTVSEGDYVSIEHVYAFHPAIDNMKGKEQIAAIYKACGMSVINDMYSTATMGMRLEHALRANQSEGNALKRALQALKEEGSEANMDEVNAILDKYDDRPMED